MPPTTPHHIRARMTGEDPYTLSNFNYALVFSGAAKTVTVPAGAGRVIFSPAAGADFWVRSDGQAATIPAVDTTDGTASFPNPVERDVSNIATFSVIAASGVKLGLAWYIAP